MGKASSSKKVTRAARAGGSRARSAGERNFLFPAAVVLVVVLGIALVVYARDQRQADALEAPIANQDHWHSAYGIYACDAFLPNLPEYVAPQNAGNHTHGDGLLHIHPFSPARAGENATLVSWLNDAGEALGSGGTLSNTEVSVPGGETYIEGDTECEGVEGEPIVQVAVWTIAASALAGDDPDEVVTENFEDIRFERDGQAYTIAFLPEGEDIPPPESAAGLSGVGSDLGADPEETPGETDTTGTDDTSSTTEGSDSTDTSAPDDTSTDDTTDTTEGASETTETSDE